MALGFGEKLEVIGIVALACVAEVAVKIVRLPRLCALLGIALVNYGDEDRPLPPSRELEPTMIQARARAVDRVYRHWPRTRSCLRRALVLGYRVRRARPVLLIGVAREEEGDIRAHAWIEVNGEVVGDQHGDWAPLRSHEDTR